MGKLQKQPEPIEVRQLEPIPKTRVTLAEIREEKRKFIRENMLLSADEGAEILNVSSRTLLEWAKDGKYGLEVVDATAVKTGQLSAHVRFTAVSIERCRTIRTVPADRLKE